MKPKPTAVERAERRVIRAATYFWKHVDAEGEAFPYPREMDLREACGELHEARRASRKKAGRK